MGLLARFLAEIATNRYGSRPSPLRLDRSAMTDEAIAKGRLLGKCLFTV